MKTCTTYRRIIIAGCLFYSILVEADQVDSGKNGTSKHKNTRLLPEDCGVFETTAVFRERPHTEEFPWLALLKYRLDDGPQFLCEGFLISDRYVLTAAQCISTAVYPLVAVRLGEDDINTDPDCETGIDTSKLCAPSVQDIAVQEVIPHPKYNTSDRNHYNDIALIRLKTPVKFNEYLQPICLPFGDIGSVNLSGKSLKVSGWNKTENFTQSDVKRKAQVSVVAFDKCSEKYKNLRVVIDNDKEICAGDNMSRWCGVSGSPLMGMNYANAENRFYAHGLLSFGPALCRNRSYPEVYTKISYYLNWILDTIRS